MSVHDGAWDDFDPEGVDDPERIDAFFASGERIVESLLRFAGELATEGGRSLEIGCGIGRLTLPMARRFREARATDIEPQLLRRMYEQAQTRKQLNVRGYLASEEWDKPDSVDFVYSWRCFQFIEDFPIIESYLRRIARTLKPTGIACLQFDTRARGPVYRLARILPGFLIPREWSRRRRSIRRAPHELHAAMTRSGLRIDAERDARSETHLFRLQRRD